MKFNQQLKLAAYNLVRRKKTTAQCVAMISVILLLIFLSSFFISTLLLELSDTLDNYAAKNYIMIEDYDFDLYSDMDSVLLDSAKQDALKRKFSTVGDINYYKTFDIYASSPTVNDLVVDGVAYSGNGANSEVGWRGVLKKTSAPTFSENLKKEFAQKFPSQSLIKYGRDIQNRNEVLFPEEFLEAYDLTAEQLLEADKVTLNNLFAGAKIVGITNGNLSMMETDLAGNRDPLVEIILYAEESVNFRFVYEDEDGVRYYPYIPYTYQRIDLNSAAEVTEIVEYISDILGDGYLYKFMNSSRLHRLEFVNKILIFTRDIILIMFGVIGVALLVFLYSVMSHGIKQKGAYLGMTRAMGLKSNQTIILLEVIIMTAASALIALVLSVIAANILKGIVISISWTSQYKFTLLPALFAAVFAASVAVVLAINTALALIASRQENSKSITEALRG